MGVKVVVDRESVSDEIEFELMKPVWKNESKQEAMHQFRYDNHTLSRPVKIHGVNFDVFIMSKPNDDN